MTVRDFSQYGEQPIILDFVKKNPHAPRYCVDAGAYDGEVGSNSRALFLDGWSGVVIEPDPRTFARLSALYKNRRDVRCVKRALSDRPKILFMLFSKGPPGTPPDTQWQYAQVNTFDDRFADEYRRDHSYEYFRSPVIVSTLTRVLKKVGAPRDIGFMTIDCEGQDVKIINELDLAKYRPRLLCIEANDNVVKVLSNRLESFGYVPHARTRANAFYRLHVPPSAP